MAWYNADGLKVRFHGEEDTAFTGLAKDVEHVLVVDYNAVTGDGLKFTTDRNNNGTNDGWSGEDAFIPAGAYITDAYILVTEAFTDSGSDATLTIGLAQEDGTVIDADGIDATIAFTALNATTDVVACDGDYVGRALKLAANAYLYATVASGPFTAGKAKIVVKYLKV
jgi:hypothetical protein